MIKQIVELWLQASRRQIVVISCLFVLIFVIIAAVIFISITQNNKTTSDLDDSKGEQSTLVSDKSSADTADDNQNQVGETKPWVGISSPHLTLGHDGVVMLSSLDEPYIELSSYDISKVNIQFYQANKDLLLEFLVHDEENQQVTTAIDTDNLNLLATTTVSIRRNADTRLDLPIEDTGIIYATIEGNSDQEVSKSFFVVRSDFGVLLKEAEDKFVFWGQSYKDLRSIKQGRLDIYNLENKAKRLTSASFNSDGIVEFDLDGDADIAIAVSEDSVSVIPINVRYLNSNWRNYQIFAENQVGEKHFVFTDRPLYRPGDTIYYKAILRDDNDAQYSIPSGRAEVSLWSGWGSQEPLNTQEIDLSPQGSIDGEFVLPDDSSTGYYRLTVEMLPKREQPRTGWFVSSSGASTNFQVEYFRKPEYSIDISAEQTEYIAGEKAHVKISGSYFSGQPLKNSTVKYSIYSADFYDYSYYSSRSFYLNDDYRYGYWRSTDISSGSVTLDEFGEATIEIDTSLDKDSLRDKVFSIEAQFDGDTGNPSFARKNILVYRGNYGIYKDNTGLRYQYSVSAGTAYNLPVILVARNNEELAGLELTASIKRKNWVKAQNSSKSYHYYEEVEDLPEVITKVNNEGKANIVFQAEQPGRYHINITGKDTRGNVIAKEFYAWARDLSKPYYSDKSDRLTLSMQQNKDIYEDSDTAELFISSIVPDRDVFISLERDYMHRYKVVSMDGSIASVEVPLKPSDKPNIFAKASSFSDNGYEAVRENLLISTEDKKLLVDIETDQEEYGPGETVTLDVKTSNINGSPVVAETAIWAVDKSIFELVDEKPHQIYETFWKERYNNTREAHSLMGISVHAAEGGGCFAGDTQVLMSDGSTKSIENIEVGDTVLTKEGDKTDRLVKARVTEVMQHQVPGYLIINGNLKVTPVHVININGEWQPAGNIQAGDLLVGQDSQSVLVQSVEWQLGDFTVYNLEIDTYHTYIADGVWVHNNKGGGGGARSIFKDTAYWNPVVRTNAAGLARVRFTLPDNLTTWVVSSIGSTNDTKVGKNRKEIIVTKDVIVRPIMPNVLREGDEMILSALVQNYTDQDQEFKTNLDFDSGIVGLTRLGTRHIESRETEHEYWQINPKTPNKQASLTFKAESLNDVSATDAIIQKIPVKPLGFTDKYVETGINEKSYNVNLSDQIDEDATDITLSLAPSVLGTLPQAAKYLINYPYGCAEQTTSRFVPVVIAKSAPELFAEAMKDKDIDDMVKTGLKRLGQLQNNDGGWGWWYGSTDAFVGSYIVEYIKLAQDLGFEVNSEILQYAQVFFERGLNDKNISLEESIPVMYALSLLGSDKAQPINFNRSLSPDLQAMAVMSNIRLGVIDPGQNGLNLLVSQAQDKGSGVYWTEGDSGRFGSKDASTALAIRALIAGNADKDLISKAARYLALNRQKGYWSNTFGTAQVMRALSEYSNFVQEIDTNYTYTVMLDDQELASGSVNSFRQHIPDIKLLVSSINDSGSQLLVTKTGIGQLYSTLVVESFRKDIENAAVSNGVSITREYFNESRPLEPFGVGDTVKIKLRVDGLSNGREFGVIKDELPAGLVPINESFKNEQYNRSDRWWYAQEITENGVIIPLRRFFNKNRDYEYRARVVSEGKFQVPPAYVETMYDPEVFGRSSFSEFRTGQFLDD